MTRPPHAVDVIDAGLLSTVQDLGRSGGGAMGVSPSGAADWFAACAANRLVGNADNAALLETTLSGITLEPNCDVRVALTGAAARLVIGGVERGSWRSCRVRAHERIEVGAATRGARSYIAFGGGGLADVPLVMGSAATDVGAGFGGKVLADGDVLILAAASGPATEFSYPSDAVPSHASPVKLRAMLGPQAADVGDGVVQALFATHFRASARSSRQAVRLDGEPIAVRAAGEWISCGLTAGCVQLPGDGLPIVMLAEHQTTGGYPIVLCVIRADLPLAGQLRAGDVVVFERVDFGGARAALYECAAKLNSLRPATDGPEDGIASRLARGFLEGTGS